MKAREVTEAGPQGFPCLMSSAFIFWVMAAGHLEGEINWKRGFCTVAVAEDGQEP